MGGSASKEPARNVEIKELATRNIITGYHVRYDFTRNVTCITYIEFDPTKTYKKTTATVEVLKNKSTFVKSNPPGRIYKQVNIWVGNKVTGLPDSHENAYTGFKVDKEWIKNNSVEESNIPSCGTIANGSRWPPRKQAKMTTMFISEQKLQDTLALQ
jgi:PGF-pre-PGF domain-containing protein